MKTSKKLPTLLLLIILVGFPQISETIFTPSLPEIATSYGVSLNTAQLTLSIYFFAFAIGVFFWGRLSDIFGRRPAMLYGIIVYGIGSVLCFLSQNMTVLLIARFIQAFGASTGSVTTQTILRESYTGNTRNALFAKISAALAFTPAIGPIIGGTVGQYVGFRAVFMVLVLMSIGIYIYTFLKLPETYDKDTQVRVAIIPITKRLITNPVVLTFGMLIAILNGILFSYYAEAPFIFMEHFGMQQATYGLLGILVASAAIFGAMLSNYLLKKMKVNKIIILGLGLMLAGSVFMLGVSCTAFLPPLVQLILLLVSVFITLTGSGMVLPNCLSLALVDFGDVIGTAGALFSLGYYFLVSAITFGMSTLHNGQLYMMPLYFLLLISVMLFFSIKYLMKKEF